MRNFSKLFKHLHQLYAKQLFIFSFILFTAPLKTTALDYYWVGNTGNWSDLSHWATTSGGTTMHTQIPTAVDDVFFDVNSFSIPNQVVSIDAPTAYCRNINCTGATNNAQLTNTPSSNLWKIFGSSTFLAGMYMSYSGLISFESTIPGQTITMAGSYFQQVQFNGIGGGWTLQDEIRVINHPLILNAGILNTNNQTIHATGFKSAGSFVRTLNMGSSVFDLQSYFSGPIWDVNNANMTINCGTSVINCTNTNDPSPDVEFNGGGMTYNDVNFNIGYGSNGNYGYAYTDQGNTFHDISYTTTYGSINDNNTVHNVVFPLTGIVGSNTTINSATFLMDGTIGSGNVFNNLNLAPGRIYTFEGNGTTTINGTLNASGNCSSLINISSNSIGVAATISHPPGAINISFAALKDIHATGGATFTATSSADLGNNTGWNFFSTGSQNLFWIGDDGHWSDGNHWSHTSGGPPSGCAPTPNDDVFFDANSFSMPDQRAVIDIPIAYCRNITCAGIAYNAQIADTLGANTWKIYGSATFQQGIYMNYSNLVSFEANTPGKTITMAGSYFQHVLFNGIGGGWTLQDEIRVINNPLVLNAGFLNTNNQTIHATEFISKGTLPRRLDMGSSLFDIVSYSENAPVWEVDHANMTVNCGTSVINCTNTNYPNTIAGFYGGGMAYNDVNFHIGYGSNGYSGTAHIIDDNTFHDISFITTYGDIGDNNTIHNVVFPLPGVIGSNNTINSATFLLDGTIGSGNVFNNLNLTSGRIYTLEGNGTTTINGTLNASGNCGSLINISSGSTGVAATVSRPSGVINISFAALKDIHATGGATFTATSSVDLGNNTGWNFSSSGSQNLYWIGDDGHWSDGNHWSHTSGGPPSGCAPTPNDDVFFDANSFSMSDQRAVIDIPIAYCRNIICTGVAYNAQIVDTLGATTWKIYGSATFQQGMYMNYSKLVSFEATSTGKTVTMAGSYFQSVLFNGIGGGWTLQDEIRVINNPLVLNAGFLNTNNQTIHATGFFSNGTYIRRLDMGSSLFDLNYYFSGSMWEVNNTNMTLNCGTSYISCTNTNDPTPANSFYGGGMTYNDVSFRIGYGGGYLGSAHIDNNNTFHDIVYTNTQADIGDNNTIHNVIFPETSLLGSDNTINSATFIVDGSIGSGNVFNDLNFTAGRSYTLEESGTTTINDHWRIQGTCTSYILLQTPVAGSFANVIKPSGSVLGHNIHIKDIHCSGGASFLAYNSVDLGGNTGWNFATLPALANPGTIIGPSAICTITSGIVYHIAPVQGAIYYEWAVPAGASITSGQGDTLIIVDFGTATSGDISVQSFNGCSYGAVSSTLSIAFGANLSPTVTLNANTGTTICPGTLVTFTATVPNAGGGSLIYNFKINGSSVQNGSSDTYTTSSLVNASNVACEITLSGSECFLSTTVVSNTLIINVAAQLTPTVTLTAVPATAICPGTSVTFTATAANTSGYPVNYDFKINGSSIQSGGADTFVTSSLLNADNVTCVISISGGSCLSTNTATSNVIAMVINTTITASVIISANPGTTICELDEIDFTATAINTTNATVTYDFKINGASVQTSTFNTYHNFTPLDGDVVTCDISLSGGNACYASTTATSNTLSITVMAPLTPEVILTASPGNTVCTGSIVNFDALVYNTGTGTVDYEFVIDGNTVQYGSSSTYSTTFLNSNDVLCYIYVNGGGDCFNTTTAFDDSYITVTPAVTPTATLIANTGTSICPGTSVTFTVTVTNNGGGAVNYNFKINGNSVQNSNSATYTNSALVNADNVTCEISLSGSACVSSTNVMSNTLTMNITAQLTPTVTLAATPGTTICIGQPVTFTATATNTNGNAVSYDFRINGSSVQSGNSNTYVSTSLLNADVITCIISISGGSCFTTNTATSNSLMIVINSPITPAVTLSGSPTTSCDGEPIYFTATSLNTGSAVINYYFYVNGMQVQSGNSNTYNDIFPLEADVVTCSISLSGISSCYTSTTAVSDPLTVYTTAPLTPGVTLTANPGTTVCTGTLVTFNALSYNTGTGTVQYEFVVDGNTVQYSSSNVYTTSFLSSANVVCNIDVFGGDGCYTTTSAFDGLFINIGPAITPTVTLNANTGTSICQGTPVTFTATVTNSGGGTVNYNFKINGSSVQTSSSNTYTSSTLANNDNITCDITLTGSSCVSSTNAVSNTLTMILTAQLTPAVTLAAVPGTTICSGQSITFTATATNTSGSSVNYDFRINGSSVQSGGSNTYVTTSLLNADNVTCVITLAGGSCFTTNTVTSNSLVIIVNGAITPTVTLSAPAGTSSCNGTAVNFIATATNTTGATVTYSFNINGSNVQSGSSNTYNDIFPLDGDIVTCSISLSGSISCFTSTTVTSNTLTISIATPLFPQVTLTANPGTTVCTTTPVTINASVSNAGNAAIQYEFVIDGNTAQLGTASTFASTFSNNSAVQCYISLSGGSDCYTTTSALSNTVNIVITAPITPTVSLVSDATTVCPATVVTFTATAANTGGGNVNYDFEVNGAGVQSGPSNTFASTLMNNDIVTCNISISGGICYTSTIATSNAITINIDPNTEPVNANAGNDITIHNGETTLLSGSGDVGTYLWSPTTSLSNANILDPVASPTTTTTYTLTITIANGCVGSDYVVVGVTGGRSTAVSPANAFTPNSDGINDRWIITTDNTVIAGSGHVIVMSRDGKRVYESNSYQNDWQGTYKGNALPDGTYYFVAEYKLTNGATTRLKGNVTILR